MKHADRRFLLSLACAGALALSGCAGHEAAGAPPARHYTETISSVLVSEDGKSLAAIGANHHYLFTAPEPLVRALHSPVHSQLVATFSAFHVDARGTVTGDWTLALPADAAPAQRQAAAGIGLAPGADGSLQASGTLVGRRYTGWTYRFGREQDRLNKPYVVEIDIDASTADAATDAAATPIRLAADGVQMIYVAPLAPLVIPFLFLTRAKDH
jgi:hypothetical protein